MIRTSNLSHMTIKGWQARYKEILKEFNYNRKNDYESAKKLSLIVKNGIPLKNLKKLIEDKSIFVIGAGPSLVKAIPTIRKYNKITKIVADGAIKPLIDNKIYSNIVVTDLDGDIKSLKRIGKTSSTFVVHAHGDNSEKLHIATHFKNCIGTTQGKPFGKIYNFGGFTDGDRCVFLANYFRAKKIILFGMDFGNKIGKYSKTKISNRQIKLKKLRKGKKLLEWLAAKNTTEFYTTSKPIRGFKKILYKDIKNIISSKNAF